jgi:hypothetical protein
MDACMLKRYEHEKSRGGLCLEVTNRRHQGPRIVASVGQPETCMEDTYLVCTRTDLNARFA